MITEAEWKDMLSSTYTISDIAFLLICLAYDNAHRQPGTEPIDIDPYYEMTDEQRDAYEQREYEYDPEKGLYWI